MNKAFLKSFSLVLSLEMILAPITIKAHAQSSDKTFNTLNNVINAAGTVVNTARQLNPAPRGQVALDMNALAQQQSPQPDKYFNLQSLRRIPGLMDYLALNRINPNALNCATLPTTLHDARPEVCRLGITNDSGVNQQAQLAQMYGYYNQYFQINKLYKNYQVDSNVEGQSFGIGCMKNAMNILNGFFKYRLNELDKLTTSMEKIQNDFKQASRLDLDAIEESVAVLEGNSPLAAKALSRNPDLFDFGRRFNNVACQSIFSAEQINENGRGGGLNAIDVDLKKILNEKKGKFSGASYAQSHNAVVEDIKNLSESAAKQFKLNFDGLSKDASGYGKFLQSLPASVSSRQGINRALTPDLFSDVQIKFNENYVKLNERRSTLDNELRAGGVNARTAINLLGNLNTSNLDNEIKTIENDLKNKCFQDTLRSFNKDLLMSKIFDPTASRHANKYSSNFLKDKLDQIISNRQTSLDKKLSELRSLEKQTQSRYFMRMENKYEVQEVGTDGKLQTRVVNPSSMRTPSVFFSDLIKNCKTQFKVNKLNNQLSGSEAIAQLKSLRSDYQKLANSGANDLKNELQKRMIDCNSPEQANSTLPGSCDSSKFDTSSSGFCAKGALSCSKNMQACSAQANQLTKEVKAQKTMRVNNYKALVEKNKQDIIKLFDSALVRYMQQGEALRGIFGAGFSSPKDIVREVPEQNRYLNDFQQATSRSLDGALLLEDPDKYVEMFKENINSLKESVKKQQDQILGGENVGNNSGLLAEHINNTEKNYQNVEKEAESRSQECIAKHDEAVRSSETARNEQMQKHQELGEKQQEFCRRFNMAAGGHPGPACDGNFEEIISAAQAVDSNAASELQIFCDQTQNSSDFGYSKTARAIEVCMKNGFWKSGDSSGKSLKNYCSRLMECNSKKDRNTEINGEREIISGCAGSAEEEVYAKLVLEATPNAQLTLQAESAPAFCQAASNSTNRFADILEKIESELTTPSSGAYGM